MIHAEVVLQGDSGKRLCGSLHLHTFLGLDSLVETVAVAATLHDTARLLIYNLHLSVLGHHIFHIALEHGVSLEKLVHSVNALSLDRVVLHESVLLGKLLVVGDFFVLHSRKLGSDIGKHEE